MVTLENYSRMSIVAYASVDMALVTMVLLIYRQLLYRPNICIKRFYPYT